ncbi:Transposable element P transposase [Aphis craccivora]|uniref:Transposable element P transposase n=1 Tax=Aphis craccivora TaxID=307492 RepID=A0A6G0YUJ4_APHCR|nr:Transposable element P transposase [Aphis craccivora]
MNNLFDCLNQGLGTQSPLAECSTRINLMLRLQFIFIDKLINGKGKVTLPPCFNGFTQTINGVLRFLTMKKQ